MCWLCEEEKDGVAGCQDCGRIICFDVESGDDVIRSAYITESGDLFCDLCGPQYDQADEEDFYGDTILDED